MLFVLSMEPCGCHQALRMQACKPRSTDTSLPQHAPLTLSINPRCRNLSPGLTWSSNLSSAHLAQAAQSQRRLALRSRVCRRNAMQTCAPDTHSVGAWRTRPQLEMRQVCSGCRDLTHPKHSWNKLSPSPASNDERPTDRRSQWESHERAQRERSVMQDSWTKCTGLQFAASRGANAQDACVEISGLCIWGLVWWVAERSPKDRLLPRWYWIAT